MKLLVLGGTVFVGRHFAQAAISRGHDVTLFHRGRRGLDVLPELRRYLGDRDGGLDAIVDREYDAVVDCCGYVPRVVGQSVDFFRGSAARYLFVSTISVYGEPILPGLDESAALAGLEDPAVEAVTGETYGGLKVLCERAVEAAFGDRALIVRPGLIVGPFDPTNRFTYWVHRVARGGDMILPEPNHAMQLIDARDLAAFMVGALEKGLAGTYNAAGPQIDLFGMVDACRPLCPETRIHRWSEAQLAAAGLEHGRDFPLTSPSTESDALWQVSSAKAIAAGLRYRPLEESARDVWDWRKDLVEVPGAPGLDEARERELLAAGPRLGQNH